MTEEVRMCGLKCWLCVVSRCAGLQPVSVVLVSCRTSLAMLDSSGVDCRTPRRFTLRHKKWKYRGEGNANLVLALTQVGVIVPHFDGTALQVCGNGWLVTRRPCSTLFFFCFNARYQYTPHLHLRLQMFGLTPIGRLLSVSPTPTFQYFLWESHFLFSPLFFQEHA
jgi:hypothetical protein